jgi:hypothetical protein
MRSWFQLLALGAATSVIASGCTMKNASVPPAQLMSELQAGQPMLDCRADCGLSWANNRQQAALLDTTGQWQPLALLVMQIGYMDDLTYYYLGHAAENLGYLQAAQRYYRIAEQISVTNMSCHQGEVDAEATLGLPVSECNGYVFPDALYSHLETVESQLAAMSGSPPPPPSPHKKRVARKPSRQAPTAAATAAAPSTAAGSGFVVPTPTAGAAPAGSGSGFVEPQPASATPSSDQFAIPPVRH